MVITPHAIASVLIATNFERLHVSNPRRWSRTLTVLAVLSTAFCSHFLLDFIPHYDYWIYGPDKIASAIKILTDFTIALAISGFVLKKQVKNLIAWASLQIKNHRLPSAKERPVGLPLVLTTLTAIAFSLTPDVLVVFSRATETLTGTLIEYRALHDLLHSSARLKPFWGIAIQLLTVLILFGFGYRSRSKLNREVEENRKISEEVRKVCAEVAYGILKKK